GALTFFILLSPLIEIDRNRTDNRSGMTLVGLATAAGLIWLGRRLRVESVAAKETITPTLTLPLSGGGKGEGR
ncbi:MAG TPA: hypothetical protein VLD63_08810, partial [Anaerolineales bacterium]|nr:hypothetical protein [Anaerolineales bacterium]